MSKKEQIQELNYMQLSNAKVNPIQARYIAFKLADLEAEIEDVEIKKEYILKIFSNKGTYLITLPNIPIPDAKIELI